MYRRLRMYIAQSVGMFDLIPTTRKRDLDKIADWVRGRTKSADTARLTFICTHNSRRSQMAQVWAQTAAAWYKIPGVTAYSGGTEVRALNPRVVSVLKRAGFRVEKRSGGKNAVHLVWYDDQEAPVTAYSKLYNQDPNPQADFCAVMTCSAADQNCPVVLGASSRVSTPYDDPQDFDDTDGEKMVYDERCLQISYEILYSFARADV